MVEALKRWNGSAWVTVAAVNRIEAATGNGFIISAVRGLSGIAGFLPTTFVVSSNIKMALPVYKFMTSNTAPSPQVASADNEISGWPPWQAFDAASTTGWATATPSNGVVNHWLKLDLGVAKVVNRATITSRTDGFNNQAPKDFEIHGSNDNSTWTVLDSRANQVFAVGEKKTFDIANTTAYRYYRLFIIRNNGHTINDALSDFALLLL